MHATRKNVDQDSSKIRGDCTIIKLTSFSLLLKFAELWQAEVDVSGHYV